MKWLVSAAAALVAVFAITSIAAASNGSGGITGPAIYYNGALYRTVATPTHHFAKTGAPDHSFDTIYALSDYQDHNVADAAPGAPNFNGGRWMVVPVSFNDYDAALAAYDTNNSGDFDSAAEIEAAVNAGDATLLPVSDSFECPMIPVPPNQ